MDLKTKTILFNEVKTDIEKYVYSRYGARNSADYKQVALMGVWNSLDKFQTDNNRGNLKLWCIRSARNSVITYIRQQSPLTEPDKQKIKRIKETEELLRSQGKFQIDLLREMCGLSYEDFIYLYSIDNVTLKYSLDIKVASSECGTGGARGATVGELLPQKEEDQRLSIFLKELISLLSSEEQLIIVLHDFLGMEMKEIVEIDSRKRSVSSMYASRTRALEKLKRMICAKAGTEVDHNNVSQVIGNLL